MIVKLQLSGITTKPKPQALIYNEDQTVLWAGDIPDDLRYLLRNYPTKSYWYAHLDKNNKIVLGARILEHEEPEW